MRFCPSCGEELREDCPECQSQRDLGSRFCIACGKRLDAGPVTYTGPEPSLVRGISILIVPVVAILLIMEVAYLLGGTISVFNWIGNVTVGVLALAPQLIIATKLTGALAQAYWLFIEITILTSIAIMAIQTWRTYKEDQGTNADRIERTSLYGAGSLFALMTVTSVIISLVMGMFGSSISTPEGMVTGNVPEALYSYANAAVWEEIITRLVYIGIPMVVVGTILTRKADSWKYLLGGFGISKLAILLVIVSALIFGFAHYDGWGFEKVIPSTAAGIILGYAYIKYGIHVSIIIHFLTDYLAVVSFTDMIVPSSFILMAVLGLGLVFLFVYGKKLWDFIRVSKDTPNWIPDRINKE